MSEAPERIRAFAEPPDNDVDMGGDKNAIGIEYIRADIHEARLKALEAKIEEILYENIHSVRGDVAGVDDALSLIIQALKT